MLFNRSNIVGLCLTFLYWILFTFTTHAQDTLNKSNKFHIGITSSINASTLSTLTEPIPDGISGYEQVYHNTPKISFKIGAIIKFSLSPHFFLVSGLSFVKNKTEISTDLQPAITDAKICTEETYSWLEMPVNVNYILKPTVSKKIFIGLGLSTRRLVDAKTRISLTTANTSSYGPEISTYSYINNWNMVGMGNIGVELPVSNKNKFLLTLSFERNLLKMEYQVDNSNALFDYGFVHSDFKINSLSLNASYLF